MGGHDDLDRGPEGMSRLALVLARPEARALVAEVAGRVIGYAELHARPSTLHDAGEGWLAALAVAADLRGHGIGRTLMLAVEREALLLGCTDIALESSAWRERAHGFYLALGYRADSRARRFRRRLAAATPAPPATLTEQFLFAAARAASAAIVAARWARAAADYVSALDRLRHESPPSNGLIVG